MAYHFYVAAEGAKPGQFKGDSPRKGWKDGTEVHSFAYGVEVPFDANQGASSGKRRHAPIIVKKQVDGASPLLMQALCTKEVLKDVRIHYVGSSGEKQVPTVNLTNATISAYNTYHSTPGSNPQPSGQGAKPSPETVYHTIQLTNATIASITPVAIPGATGPCEQVAFSPETVERIRGFSR